MNLFFCVCLLFVPYTLSVRCGTDRIWNWELVWGRESGIEKNNGNYLSLYVSITTHIICIVLRNSLFRNTLIIWSLMKRKSLFKPIRDVTLILYTTRFYIYDEILVISWSLTIGTTKGSLKLRLAAMEKMGSTTLNSAPIRIIFPVCGSMGRRARWYPRGVRRSSASSALRSLSSCTW